MNDVACSSWDSTRTTLLDVLRWRAAHQAKQRAYVFLQSDLSIQEAISYGELDRLACAIGAELQSTSVVGDRALLLHPPGIAFIAAFLGCLYAGIIAVPVYASRPKHSMKALDVIAKDSGASIVLTTSPQVLKRSVYTNLESLKWIATDNVDSDIADQFQPPSIDNESLALLQYTSGSTTQPKGVMVSHENLMHNLAMIQMAFELSTSSRGVIWLPQYHDMGLIGGILEPLYCGFEVALMSPIDFVQRPIRWLQAISLFRATISGGPNFAYDICVRRTTPEQRAELDLSSWQVAFIGAEPIKYNVMERFAKSFNVCNFHSEAFCPCYGLAEGTLLVSASKKNEELSQNQFLAQRTALEEGHLIPAVSGENASTIVGCGQVWEDRRVIIVDPESMIEVEPGNVGEIWVTGPSVALGYWNRAEETNNVFQARLSNDEDIPYLRTGDLGVVKNGELFVTGRIKELIIINGRNHYPQDIEETIGQCHPVLLPGGCAAFSVEIDGQEQLIVLAEVSRTYRHQFSEIYRETMIRAKTAPEVRFSSKDVIRQIYHVVSELHDLKPFEIVLLEQGCLPRTSSGKLQRYICRRSYLNGELSV